MGTRRNDLRLVDVADHAARYRAAIVAKIEIDAAGSDPTTLNRPEGDVLVWLE